MHKLLLLIDVQVNNAGILSSTNRHVPRTVFCMGREPISDARFQLMDYKNSKLNVELFYTSVEADHRPDSSGVWEFGLPVRGTATLYQRGA